MVQEPIRGYRAINGEADILGVDYGKRRASIFGFGGFGSFMESWCVITNTAIILRPINGALTPLVTSGCLDHKYNGGFTWVMFRLTIGDLLHLFVCRSKDIGVL